MENKAKKKFIIDFLYVLSILLIVYICGKLLLYYLFPFVFAALIAWTVQRPAKYISSKTILKTGSCAAVLSIIIYLATALVLFFVFYRLTLAFRDLINELPQFFNAITNTYLKVESSVSKLLNGISPELAEQVRDIMNETLNNVKASLGNGVSQIAGTIAKSAPSFLFSSIVAMVASCYISKDFYRLLNFLRELFGRKIYSNCLKIKAIVTNSVFRLMKGYLILMLITFFELLVSLLLLRIKHAVPLALIITIIDIFPVLGIGTVLIPWSLIEIITSDSVLGILLVVVYIIITITRNFLEPKIIGKQMGINPLFTLIAMFAGLRLFGFLGLFLAPITLIVVVKYYKNEMEQDLL